MAGLQTGICRSTKVTAAQEQSNQHPDSWGTLGHHWYSRIKAYALSCTADAQRIQYKSSDHAYFALSTKRKPRELPHIKL